MSNREVERNMKIYRKYLILGLAFVLIGASVSITATSKTNIGISVKQISSFGDRSWSDDFNSYTLGQFLDGDPTDGGWKGWDNDPTFGAFVVDTQVQSAPYSVEIVGDSDLVHEYSGYTTGQFTYIAWQYIPSDFVGETAFILLNTYNDGGDYSWSTQLRFNSDTNMVSSDYDGNDLPLGYDQWIEIRVEIDLDADIQDIYYDGDLLVSKSWKDGVTGGGVANIAAVDLFANAATAVYYDDISLTGEALTPAVCCQGTLSWTGVTPGSTMSGSFEVSNCGDTGSQLDWQVAEWPTWGTGWTFNPASGVDLTPAQGWQTVTVSFTAPTDQNKEFTGTVKVINSNNPTDFCEIPVYLKTSKSKQINNNPFLNFLQNHPNIFPLIQQVIQRLGQ